MRTAVPSILLDTNVLVYPYHADAVRARRAEDVIRTLAPTRRAVVSTQVLGEFFRVITAKLGVPAEAAYAALERHILTWPVLEITPAVVLEAARGVRDHRLDYWDAQIWATARMYQIPFVFSEDFEDGRTLDGVTFIDPFSDGFRPEDWT